MAVIRKIEASERAVLPEIVDLHKRALSSFFLTRLGKPFLKALYSGYLEDEESGIIAAEEGGKLLGFIAYSNDYPRFFKGLIKKHLVRFFLCSLGAAIRHPSFIKRLFGAFRKSENVVKEEKYVELASICVDPDLKRRGIGTILISRLIGMVDFSRNEYINLETDAEGNDPVNAFYQKNGFTLARQFVTPEGRKMNEYRFRP